MRELGVSELELGDLRIKLGPAPRRVEPTQEDPDERVELSEEERRLAAMSEEEREHNRFWRRLTRSSGAPIPPFKPRMSKAKGGLNA